MQVRNVKAREAEMLVGKRVECMVEGPRAGPWVLKDFEFAV